MEIVTKQQKIDVLEGIFGQSTLANSGKNISVICPACKSDSKSSSRKKKLSICLNKGIYHCWVCESKGHNIAKFAIRNTFVNKSDIAILNELFSFDENKEEKEPEYILRLPEDFCLLVNATGRMGKVATSYLHKRGLTQSDFLRYKIGISSEYEFNNRVIFPSFCNDMKLNYFLSMVKKNKNTGGKGHNKVASIFLILLGLPFVVLGIMQPYMNNQIRMIILAGVILVVLGGILFKKSFLSKD